MRAQPARRRRREYDRAIDDHYAGDVDWSRPVTVGVFTPEAIAKALPGYGGTAWTKDLLLFPADDTSPRAAWGKLFMGHEMEHLVTWRITGSFYGGFPGWLAEGKAMVMGRLFESSAGVANGYPHDVDELLTVAAADAQQAFDGGPSGAVPSSYAGALFVELMRNQVWRNGDPDVMSRLEWAMGATYRGEELAAAFNEAFSWDLASAQTRLMGYLDSTQHDPAARLALTAWANLQP